MASAVPAKGGAAAAPVGAPPATELEKEQSQPAVWHIVGVQFLYVFAVAVSIPAYPYIWTYTDLANGDQVRGGSLHSLATSINAGCELLSASLLGMLSDRTGRRPFMLTACLGQALDLFIAALAAKDRPDYFLSIGSGHAWMFAARCISGLAGSFLVFAKAAVGDVSRPETSARNFAWLIATFGMGFVLGPGVGALLSRNQLQLPMLVSSGIMLIAAVCILLMREPLLPQNRAILDWRKMNPLGALQFLWTTRFLIVFAAMSFLDQFALVLLQTIILQYCTAVFGVGRGIVTGLLVVFGVGQGVAYALVLRPIVRKYGEITAVEAGYVLTCLAFALLAVISYIGVFWPMFLVMALLAVGAISNPAESALASCHVDRSEQGRLQAANGCLDVVGKMTGSLGVFAIFEPSARAGQPGLVWWFACLVMVPGVVLAFRLKRALPQHQYGNSKPNSGGEEDWDRGDHELGDGVVPCSGPEAVRASGAWWPRVPAGPPVPTRSANRDAPLRLLHGEDGGVPCMRLRDDGGSLLLWDGARAGRRLQEGSSSTSFSAAARPPRETRAQTPTAAS